MIELPGITTERALATTARVLPELQDRLDALDDPGDVLADAFCAGAVWAGTELIAQLIEAGIDAHISELTLKTTGDD